MGWINDQYGADRVLSIWAILPVGVALIFTALYLRDRQRGGYQVEELGHEPARLGQQAPAAATRPRGGAGLDSDSKNGPLPTSRSGRRGWSRSSGEMPPFEPFWVLLDGPGPTRRERLSQAAQKKK